MNDNNQITVRGRVGTDPQLEFTPSGRPVTNFRLGSTRRVRDAATGEWRDGDTEWFTVKAWGSMADHVITSINRGMPVIVQGVFSTDEWTSGEQLRYTKIITATAVAVDIRYGLVRHVKVVRKSSTETNGTTANGSSEGSADDAVTSADTAAADAAAADVTAAYGAATDGPTDEDHDADGLEEQLGSESDPWATTPVASS